MKNSESVDVYIDMINKFGGVKESDSIVKDIAERFVAESLGIKPIDYAILEVICGIYGGLDLLIKYAEFYLELAEITDTDNVLELLLYKEMTS